MAVSKVYNGTAWVDGIIKTYNGTAWVEKPAFYNGTAWVDLYASSFTWGTSAIPDLEDITNSGTQARCGAKWSSDGSVYWREASGLWGTAQSSWIGNGANTDYEGRWTKLFDNGDVTSPRTSTGTSGVWHTMATDVMVASDTPADDFDYDAVFRFELRLTANPGTVVITDNFNMKAQELI